MAFITAQKHLTVLESAGLEWIHSHTKRNEGQSGQTESRKEKLNHIYLDPILGQNSQIDLSQKEKGEDEAGGSAQGEEGCAAEEDLGIR